MKTWRRRVRHWLGPAIVIAFLGGLLWTTLRQVDREGPAAAAARMGEAMSKAAHQRLLTP